MTVVMLGCDPHLDTLAVSAMNGIGTEIEAAEWPNTEEGWAETAAMCQRLGISRVGIEGASGYGRRLAQTLVSAGMAVVEVPTRLTARTRRVDGAGKTDPGDARTIARAVLRGEGGDWNDDACLETLRVLSHRRDALVGDQTADVNALRALLVEVDPQRAATTKRLRSRKAFTELTQVDYDGDTHRRAVSELIAEIAADCRRRLDRIDQLQRRISDVMPPVGWALTRRQGCAIITAAQILAEVAGTDRFATDAKMAAWAGTAPLDASSGRQQHHRLNPGGNRQANRAIHTIVTTQYRHRGEAHTYITGKMEQNITKKAAIRAAKRHVTRQIWKTLRDYGLTP